MSSRLIAPSTEWSWGPSDERLVTSDPAVLTLPWASIDAIATVVVDGNPVTLCHYPMKTWPKAHKGAIHLFGHMHGRLKGTSRSLDIGVDCWGFRPGSYADIARRLRTLPPDQDLAADMDDTP